MPDHILSSINYCRVYCKSKGKPYAAVRNRNICSCGYDFGVYGRVPNSDCNINCEDRIEPTSCGDILGNGISRTYSSIHPSAVLKGPSVTTKVSPRMAQEMRKGTRAQARSSLGKNTDFMVCKMPKMSKNRQKPSEFQAFIDFSPFSWYASLARCASIARCAKKEELRLCPGGTR